MSIAAINTFEYIDATEPLNIEWIESIMKLKFKRLSVVMNIKMLLRENQVKLSDDKTKSRLSQWYMEQSKTNDDGWTDKTIYWVTNVENFIEIMNHKNIRWALRSMNIVFFIVFF